MYSTDKNTGIYYNRVNFETIVQLTFFPQCGYSMCKMFWVQTCVIVYDCAFMCEARVEKKSGKQIHLGLPINANY